MFRSAMLTVVLGWLAGIAGCENACRVTDSVALDPQCLTNEPFETLHFDSSSTFESFLINQCKTPDSAIATVIAQVDFQREVVICTSGPLADPEVGCLRDREVAEVAVCTDGVQLIFEDLPKENADFCTTAMWSLCERMERDEVREVFRLP